MLLIDYRWDAFLSNRDPAIARPKETFSICHSYLLLNTTHLLCRSRVEFYARLRAGVLSFGIQVTRDEHDMRLSQFQALDHDIDPHLR